MWLDIYPKFNMNNINNIYYERDEIINAFNNFDISKKSYVEYGYNDSLPISLKNIVGYIKEIKTSNDGMIADFYLLNNNNNYFLTDDILYDFVLGTTKTGNVIDNKGKILSIEKLNLIHINQVINKFHKRKRIIDKLLSNNTYNIKK